MVDYQEPRRRHIVVYDEADELSKRRVYAHKLEPGKGSLRFSLLQGNGSVRKREGPRIMWTRAEEDALVKLGCKLEDDVKQCERARADRLWLWAAVACHLGRLPEVGAARSLKVGVRDSVMRQYRVTESARAHS